MIVGFKDLRLKTDLSRSLYKPEIGNTRCLYRWHWWRNIGRSYSKLLLLGWVNKLWYSFQYYYQIRANFIIYKNSINYDDNDSDGNGNSNSNSNSDRNSDNNSDNNGDNKGDSIKKTCTQDELSTLINHEITTM